MEITPLETVLGVNTDGVEAALVGDISPLEDVEIDLIDRTLLKTLEDGEALCIVLLSNVDVISVGDWVPDEVKLEMEENPLLAVELDDMAGVLNSIDSSEEDRATEDTELVAGPLLENVEEAKVLVNAPLPVLPDNVGDTLADNGALEDAELEIADESLLESAKESE